MPRPGFRLSHAAALLSFCLATIACGPGSRGGGPTAGSGGRGGGAVAGTGGVNGTGGSLAGSGGGPATGGTSASGGSAGTAGASSGGMSVTGGGSAGAPGTGGVAGQAGAGAGGAASGGAGGGAGAAPKPPAIPSSGCGEPVPELGSPTSPLMVLNHKYYIKLPASYDASKPSPLLFVFHGTADSITWGEIYSGLESRAYNAIRVYPYSGSTGWGPANVPFFMPLYDQLTSHLCVDKARVFAAGSDSGGDFASILGCEYASVLRGVAPSGTQEPRAGTPQAAYPWDVTMRTCTGHVTAFVIHGVRDVTGPENGPKLRDFYRSLNHCGTETTVVPSTIPMNNCVQYQGCDAGFPVYFCQHADPTYADTNHGWPPFVSNMVWSVFNAY